MAEASEAMKVMARRIAAEFAPYNDTAVGCAIATIVEKVALVSIIETQRLDAELADSHASSHERIFDNPATNIAQAIRTGNHYAKDENNG